MKRKVKDPKEHNVENKNGPKKTKQNKTFKPVWAKQF